MGTATDKDYFGSFLGSGGKGQEDWARPEPSAEMEKQVLRFLEMQKEPVSLRELLIRLDLPPSLAIGTVNRLRESGLLEVNSVEDDERVALTDLGRRLAI
jgi:Mn-dependent DtxR family transcriptional regulator